jgi:chitinase
LSGAKLSTTDATIHGTCTIADNDAPPTVYINNAAVTETDSGVVNAVFKVTLSVASGKTVTVHYSTSDRLAVAGADYQDVSGTLTFAPGTRSMAIEVPVIGDNVKEGKENFVVNLSNPVNATVTAPNNSLTDSRGTGLINDDD